MIKKLALLVLASSFMLTAKADTIVASSALNTTNNSGNPTLNINPNPNWYGPLAGSNWVSYAITGNPSDPGYTVVPNGTNVIFSQTFNLSAPANGGTLSVLADDTTSVILNGNTIYAAALGGSYPTCSTQPIGCLASTGVTINLGAFLNYFNVGANTLSFQVYQEGLSSYGLDYAGTITTPEPGMFLMVGLGLVGLFVMRRRTFAGSFAS